MCHMISAGTVRALHDVTILLEVKQALLLEEAIDVDAAFMLLYEPVLCDDALDQRGGRHIKCWIPNLHYERT